MKERARRILGWPGRRLLDPRMQWVINGVDAQVGRRIDEVERVNAEINERLTAVQRDVIDEGRAVEDGVAALIDAARQLLQDRESDYVIPPTEKRSIETLRWPPAEFANWTASPHGYAAEAGLWINHPVQLVHRPGGVDVLSVNERVLEVPFAFASLAHLAAPARILDVGGSESTVALSLATMGHQVTVVDPRGYGFRHPNIEVVVGPVEELPAERTGFDAVLLISAIEHFGTGAYAQAVADDRADLRAAEDLRGRLRPGGTMVLTVPYGPPGVDDFQRVYDADGVRELVADLDVVSFSAARRLDLVTWEATGSDDPPADVGVALVAARRPGE